MEQTVGVVGLGNIGGRMATVLLDRFDVAVYDIDESRVQTLVDAGATAAESSADLARHADIIFLSLPNDSALEAATLGDGGVVEGLGDGDVLIDTSTISPMASERVADACNAAGAAFLDAPVSGGARNAETGDLTIIVGGDEAVLERVRPAFDAIARTVHHVGPQGSGVTLKVVNNYLLGVNQIALSEGLAMARSAGIDDETFADTVADASGSSYALDRNMSRFIVPDEFDSEFTLDLMEKDVKLAERFANESDVPLLLGNPSAIYRVASAMGYGNLDCSAIVKLYEELDRD